MKNLKELIILSNLPKVGKAKINSDLASVIDDVMDQEVLIDKLCWLGFSEPDIYTAIQKANDAMAELETNERFSAITIFDEEYPIQLNDLGNNRPPYFYVYGDIDSLYKESLGIIGTRHPDNHVEIYAPNVISHAIFLYSPVIVSGLANGCDTIGHKTALANNTQTIAVLPCGFNKLTRAKRTLCEDIVNRGGLIISEYSPETPETRFTPVQRDLIIAALSHKIISLQCGINSGTMHTIEAAYKMHRPIGCYTPSKMEGDFEGHKKAMFSYNAKEIKSFEDLDEFLNKKKLIETEQMSIF